MFVMSVVMEDVIQQTEVDDHTKPAVCECQNSTTDSYLKR